MTLETAKRIVLEQGEYSNSEALAVVRGGMVMIMRDKDGRRRGPWIEVLPTETDEESSIELALKNYREKELPRHAPLATPAKVPDNDSVQIIEELPSEDETFSIHSLISKWKQKLCELMKVLDELVVE